MQALITLNNLTARYDARKTDGVSSLSLTIKSKEILALVGPSGSGKTTTLKVIANMLPYQSGHIDYHDKYELAYVDQFQKLDPKKSVFENLEMELIDLIEEPEKRANQIRSILGLLEITNEINSLCSLLSGGQRQRVIIAKALIKNPTLLLLDEPFANLDKLLRTQLLEELFVIFKQKNITVIWVTHNTQEALSYSDRCALLNYGELQQIDAPQTLYYQPKNIFAAGFFTQTNLLPAKLVLVEPNEIIVKLFNREFTLKKPKDFQANTSDDVLVMILPEFIIEDSSSKFQAKIKKIIFQGSHSLVEFQYQHVNLMAQFPTKNVPVGKHFQFAFTIKDVHCLSEI